MPINIPAEETVANDADAAKGNVDADLNFLEEVEMNSMSQAKRQIVPIIQRKSGSAMQSKGLFFWWL